MKKIFLMTIAVIMIMANSCDKKTMYAVSDYTMKEFLTRQKEAQDKIKCTKNLDQITTNHCVEVYLFYAASQNDINTYTVKLKEKKARGYQLLYAYSKNDIETFLKRKQEFEKQNAGIEVVRYLKRKQKNKDKKLRKKDIIKIQDMFNLFYMASTHSIDIYNQRLMIAAKADINDLYTIAFFAMSKNSINVFKQKYAEASKK